MNLSIDLKLTECIELKATNEVLAIYELPLRSNEFRLILPSVDKAKQLESVLKEVLKLGKEIGYNSAINCIKNIVSDMKYF